MRIAFSSDEHLLLGRRCERSGDVAVIRTHDRNGPDPLHHAASRTEAECDRGEGVSGEGVGSKLVVVSGK